MKMNSVVSTTVLAFIVIIHCTDARCPIDGRVTKQYVQSSLETWKTQINLSSCSPKLDFIEDEAFSEIKRSIKTIRLNNNKLTSITHLTFTGIAYVEQVFLNYNEISSLEDGSFEWMPNLQKLYLHNNALESINEKLFTGLVNLTYLHLGNNAISTMQRNSFDQLLKLNSLFLNGNNLLSLTADVFHGLRNLKSLILSDNKLLDLKDKKVFSGLKNLVTLNINSNNISTVADGVFANLTNLQSLQLSQNAIGHITKNTFQSLSKLKSLYLHNNRIKTIKSRAFADLGSVTYLRLGSNDLTTLQPYTFDGLSKLTYLDLERNKLAVVHHDAFNGLSVISSLRITEMNITTISKSSFRGLTNLKYLYLQRNKINSMQNGAFDNLTSLTYLDLSQNKITFLYTRIFRGLGQLKHLHLYSNNITHIDTNLFSNFPKLQTINAKNNRLKSFLDIDLQSLTKLKTLILSNNDIEIPSTSYFPSSLQNVTDLQLGNNKLATISDITFSNLTRIQILDISENLISIIDNKYSFTHLKNLTYLNLSYNSIEYLHPRLFSKCSDTRYVCPHSFTELHTIDISYNKIKTISPAPFLYRTIGTSPLAFRRKSYIELNLEHNNIESIQEFILLGPFQQRRPLYTLQPLRMNLKSNKLTTIPDFMQNSNFYQHDPSYIAVNYLDNPLHCNCELQSLYNWLTADSTSLHDAQYITCQSPFSGLLASTTEPLRCLPPKDITITHDYNVTADSYSITCTAKGDPAPTITWITSNDTLTFLPSIDRRILSNKGTIDTTANTARKYTCIAKNLVNSSSVTMTLGEILAQTTMKEPDTSTVASTVESQFTDDYYSSTIGLGIALGLISLFAFLLTIALLVLWRRYKVQIAAATANKTDNENVTQTCMKKLHSNNSVVYENTTIGDHNNEHTGQSKHDAYVNAALGIEFSEGQNVESILYENEKNIGYETLEQVQELTEMASYETLKSSEKPQRYEHDYIDMDED